LKHVAINIIFNLIKSVVLERKRIILFSSNCTTGMLNYKMYQGMWDTAVAVFICYFIIPYSCVCYFFCLFL